MTRSPGLNSVTSGPTRSTTPANSPPGENGNGGLVWYLPAMIRVSKKFNPTAATLATTSRGPATGSAISAITRSSAAPNCWQRTAFTGGTLLAGERDERGLVAYVPLVLELTRLVCISEGIIDRLGYFAFT